MKHIDQHRIGKGLLALTVGTLLALPSAGAMAMQDEHAFHVYHEVPDHKLDAMRGRFVSGNQILFFGVEMYTEWKTAMGDSYGASLRLGIDRSSSRIRPTVTVMSSTRTMNAGGAGGAATSGANQISSGGLDQVKGVSQAVQVTGNANGIANSIGVDVGTQRPDQFGAADPALAGGNKTVMDMQTGAVARTFVDRNNIGVAISVPGQGNANQTISSMIGMQQRAQVFGDMNSINNRLNLMIQLQAGGAVASTQVNNLLQSVRGLGQAGLF